jgi:excisionase family DNA binding protein
MTPDTTTITDAEPALINVKQVAKLLGVSTRAVATWSDSGRLPGKVKIGRSARWRLEDIQAWLKAGCPAISPNE